MAHRGIGPSESPSGLQPISRTVATRGLPPHYRDGVGEGSLEAVPVYFLKKLSFYFLRSDSAFGSG